MSQTLEFRGLKEAGEALKELEKTVVKKIVRKGLRAGAKTLVSVSKSEAPKRTGLMGSKIKVRSGGSRKGTIRITIGVDAKDFTGQAFYAGFVLFGHRVGSRKLGAARKLVPANNFLKRAFDMGSDSAVEVTIETWGTLTEQAIANKGKG